MASCRDAGQTVQDQLQNKRVISISRSQVSNLFPWAGPGPWVVWYWATAKYSCHNVFIDINYNQRFLNVLWKRKQ